jgi:hypothetical protein
MGRAARQLCSPCVVYLLFLSGNRNPWVVTLDNRSGSAIKSFHFSSFACALWMLFPGQTQPEIWRKI